MTTVHLLGLSSRRAATCEDYYVIRSPSLNTFYTVFLIILQSGSCFLHISFVGFTINKRPGFKQMGHVKSTTVTSLKSTQQKKRRSYYDFFRRLALYPRYMMSGLV